MEVLLGIVGKDFVLTASDTITARSIVVMKRGEDKSKVLSSRSLMLYTGEPGDTVQFADNIQKNAQLYSMRHGVDMTPKATASFVRRELAESLRSRKPYNVNVLLAGFDTIKQKPELYWLDYLASSVSLNFAAHGHASYFCMSTLDRYWRPDLSLPEALALLRKCVEELKVRYIVNMPNFTVKVTDKDGIREVSL